MIFQRHQKVLLWSKGLRVHNDLCLALGHIGERLHDYSRLQDFDTGFHQTSAKSAKLHRLS